MRWLHDYDGERRLCLARVKCSGCGKTLTLFPPEVVPGFRYARAVIETALCQRAAGASLGEVRCGVHSGWPGLHLGGSALVQAVPRRFARSPTRRALPPPGPNVDHETAGREPSSRPYTGGSMGAQSAKPALTESGGGQASVGSQLFVGVDVGRHQHQVAAITRVRMEDGSWERAYGARPLWW
jgi:hypothetical protein